MANLQISPLNLLAAPAPAPLRAPSAADAQQFDAAMGSGTPTDPTAPVEATDEQMAKLSQGELDSLRAKWGGDDHGMRAEALILFQIRENIVKSTMIRIAKSHAHWEFS